MSYDFQKQDTSQNFYMAWHVILCSIGYIDVPNNGIEQACSWTSCDTHKKYLSYTMKTWSTL